MPQEPVPPGIAQCQQHGLVAPINQQKHRRCAGYTGHSQCDAAADKMACALPENPDRMPRPFLLVLFDFKPLRFLKSSLSGYLMYLCIYPENSSAACCCWA